MLEEQLDVDMSLIVAVRSSASGRSIPARPGPLRHSRGGIAGAKSSSTSPSASWPSESVSSAISTLATASETGNVVLEGG